MPLWVLDDGVFRMPGAEGILMLMRVLVTGSRTWTDQQAVWDALDAVLREHRGNSLTVVHGGAHGADQFAAEWARERRGWRMIYDVVDETHPADWAAEGRSAGVSRNLRMVALGADLCLTFIDLCIRPGCSRRAPHGSHGSVHCATAAAAAGIPVRHIAETGARS